MSIKRALCICVILVFSVAGLACAEGFDVYYQIFPYSFYDSNGDGIGDLNGVCERLDYISDLGARGIWLTPISTSASYHKYDVIDYMSIDPEFGDIMDFERLIAACDARGIRVILDLVVNHTSDKHPWFQSALESITVAPCGLDTCARAPMCRAHNPYCEYYNFVQTDAPKSGYTPLGNGWSYESVFWAGMPDLNLDNPDVRAEIERVIDFWLDMGAGGFRLDAALHFTGARNGNIAALKWIADYVHGKDDDYYLVAEVWTSASECLAYYQSGVDSLFNFTFAGGDGRTAKTLTYKGAANSAKAYERALINWQRMLNEASPEAIDAPFGSNHDVGRIAGFMRKDEANVKLYAALNLTMTGVAFVYYGEELGMSGSGKDENKRAPMYWTEDSSAPGMTKGPEGMDEQAHAFGSLEKQASDEHSIYNFYKEVVALRNAHPAISRGEISALDIIDDDDICSISKTYDGETVLLIYNLSAEREIVIDVPEGAQIAASLCALRHTEGARLSNARLACPPMSLTALTIQPTR